MESCGQCLEQSDDYLADFASIYSNNKRRVKARTWEEKLSQQRPAKVRKDPAKVLYGFSALLNMAHLTLPTINRSSQYVSVFPPSLRRIGAIAIGSIANSVIRRDNFCCADMGEKHLQRLKKHRRANQFGVGVSVLHELQSCQASL